LTARRAGKDDYCWCMERHPQHAWRKIMKTLRVAVIGVGHLGQEHARILSGLSDVKLVGVADVNFAQAQAVADRCGTKATRQFATLLSGIDAAVVAVPASFHCLVTGTILGCGIPVLVEKPLAVNLEEADELLALSKANGALLQIGHVERFNSAFEALQARPLTAKYIAGERLGGYTGRCTDVGVVLDLMVHDIDLVLTLKGCAVRAVEAFGVSVLGGHEDIAKARITFEDGCIVDLSASRLAFESTRGMQIWGVEGFAAVDFARRHLTLVQPSRALCRHRAGFRPFDSATLATLKQELFGRHLERLDLQCDNRDALTRELQDFVHCVRTGARPRAGGEEGRAALELASRILERIDHHRWDGGQAGAIGPHAYPMAGATLFQPATAEKAA
jgi:predicted dehydrogenase